MTIDYKNKYLKYKNKYLKLKGGSSFIDFFSNMFNSAPADAPPADAAPADAAPVDHAPMLFQDLADIDYSEKDVYEMIKNIPIRTKQVLAKNTYGYDTGVLIDKILLPVGVRVRLNILKILPVDEAHGIVLVELYICEINYASIRSEAYV